MDGGWYVEIAIQRGSYFGSKQAGIAVSTAGSGREGVWTCVCVCTSGWVCGVCSVKSAGCVRDGASCRRGKLLELGTEEERKEDAQSLKHARAPPPALVAGRAARKGDVMCQCVNNAPTLAVCLLGRYSRSITVLSTFHGVFQPSPTPLLHTPAQPSPTPQAAPSSSSSSSFSSPSSS